MRPPASTRLPVALLLLLAPAAQAQPAPCLLSYQGVLIDGGAPVTSATSVAFALFAAAACTSAFPTASPWGQTLSVQPYGYGVFSVLLGSTNPADAAYFAFDRALYLKTSVGGSQVACEALAAVPFALRAEAAAVDQVQAEMAALRALVEAVAGGGGSAASAE